MPSRRHFPLAGLDGERRHLRSPIGRLVPPEHVEHAHRARGKVDLEDDPPVADAAAEGVLALELHHVARQRIGGHRLKRRLDPPPVALRQALKAFARARGGEDGPRHGAMPSRGRGGIGGGPP